VFRSSEELREVLGRLLESVDADDRIGPLLRAAHLRARLEFPDRRLDLNVASCEGDDRNVEWSFARRAPWTPKVTLRMDSSVANGWLQGEESLAIAIARGRVRCSGESRSTLFFVPVAKLLGDPYRRLIEAEFEHLRIA
jgi:hypothetical protein